MPTAAEWESGAGNSVKSPTWVPVTQLLESSPWSSRACFNRSWNQELEPEVELQALIIWGTDARSNITPSKRAHLIVKLQHLSYKRRPLKVIFQLWCITLVMSPASQAWALFQLLQLKWIHVLDTCLLVCIFLAKLIACDKRTEWFLGLTIIAIQTASPAGKTAFKKKNTENCCLRPDRMTQWLNLVFASTRMPYWCWFGP